MPVAVRPRVECGVASVRSTPPDPVPASTQRRLILLRHWLVALEAAGIIGLQFGLGASLPLLPMAALLGLHLGLNLLAIWRTRRPETVAGREVFMQLFCDAAAIAALVYFSGGYANPFISLLLLPLILSAVTLDPRQAWAMTAWVALLYSMLAWQYQPLHLEVPQEVAVNLHLAGMWLNFLFTAGLVAAFVARLAGALRERDAALARAREKALRDEQLFALGMQAAAAAHDLATPLASLELSLAELDQAYAGDDELHPQIRLMRAQSQRMQAVLDRLALAAGAARAGRPETRPLDIWLHEVFEHWRLMRPGVPARLRLPQRSDMPRLRDDPSLVSILATLLNNAADASPDEVELEADWDPPGTTPASLRLRVLDRGPGLDAEKTGGWGVGLRLAEAALERLEGELHMRMREGGGLVVEARLPQAATEHRATAGTSEGKRSLEPA